MGRRKRNKLPNNKELSPREADQRAKTTLDRFSITFQMKIVLGVLSWEVAKRTHQLMKFSIDLDWMLLCLNERRSPR